MYRTSPAPASRGIHATLWNPLKFQRFCCPCTFHRSALHSFARFPVCGTQQKSETLRPHRVRTSRQKLSASTVTSCFFAFNKPLNYIYWASRMQAFFEMFFEYFWTSKKPESLEILRFLIADANTVFRVSYTTMYSGLYLDPTTIYRSLQPQPSYYISGCRYAAI